MENENTNQSNVTSPQQDNLQIYMQAQRKKRNRIIYGIVGLLAVVVIGYFGYTNPQLFKAEILPTTEPVAGVDNLYIPNYSGAAGDIGNIAIKSTAGFTDEFSLIAFDLTYSPVDALIFDSDPFVFTDSLISTTSIQWATPKTGEITVMVASSTPVTPGGVEQTIFKLETQINPALPDGTVITLGIESLEVNDELFAPLTGIGTMAAGTITVGGQNNLRVLNAEATDDTHVVVHFSDLLDPSDIGAFGDYVISDGTSFLSVSAVESGTLYGYDQTSVVLTTATQTPAGTEYILTVDDGYGTDPDVIGNTQGGLQSGFQTALFYGFGVAETALSDFGIVSAEAINYNQVEVIFTEDVVSGSLSGNFSLENINTGVNLTTSISNVALDGTDNTKVVVTLIDSVDILKKYTYSVTATDDVHRDGDNASSGIDKAVFNGVDNGPQILTAVANPSGSTYTATIDFSGTEDIQIVGTTSIGTIYVLDNGGSSEYAIGASFDVTDANFTPTVSEQTLTLTHDIFGNPDAHFAFSVFTTKVTNASDVPTDESYKMITFWGDVHSGSPTTGTLTVVNKNKIQVASGSLDFTTVDNNTNTVVIYEDSSGLEYMATDSIVISGGNLEIVFLENLEPDTHYILHIADDSDVTLVTKRFVLDTGLDVNGAVADSATEITVQFSENVDASTLQTGDFTVTGGTSTLTVSGVDANDYQNIILTTSSSMDPATVYTVTALDMTTTPDILYSWDGSVFGLNTAVFGSHETAALASDVYVSDATAVSNTKVQLTFSGAVDGTTLTPVNIKLKYDPFTTTDKLTITDITPVSGNTYELTTNTQDSAKNYFVVMSGVEDVGGLPLGNNQVPNFFGFELPTPIVTSVDPFVITNDVDQSVTLTGSNLGSDVVQTVQVGTQNVTIDVQTDTSLTITVPSGMTENLYNITLIDIESATKQLPDALIISSLTPEMQIVSADSTSLPANVPNDGTTSVTLWAKVYDPVGLDDIDDVIVDLSQIGGSPSTVMAEDTGSQPTFTQWYTYETTIPATVATAVTPYLLPVEAHKGSNIVTGTISIHVTGDVYASVAPTIDQAYVNPVSVPPDGTTPISISAQITDIDGAGTISSVVANLGSLGIGFIPLSPLDTAAVGELTTAFYQSETFTVPSTTAVGTYTISVTASDNTGESAVYPLTFIVSTQLTGPKIDASKSYVSPTKSIARGSTTPFSLHAYVTDPDGVIDVTSVTASFGVLGLAPTTLLKDPTATDTSKSAFFAVEGLIIPKTAPLGVHSVEITAEDSTGGIANLIIQIDVTFKDITGDPPRVLEDKGYTTPKVAVNDGETPITLYAFVRDDDDDIESVVVNLGNIGQVGPETAPDFAQTSASSSSSSGAGVCPTGSNVLVCMNPSVKEGTNGQWFILPSVTVSTSTMPSSEPYMVNIVATDMTGKTTQGQLPVYVNDGEAFTNDRFPPRVVTAVPTSATTVEVVFSEEISATSVSSSGAEFKITDKDDISKELDIVGATINAVGTIVTLSTANQSVGKEYVLSATSDIHDAVGVSLIAGAANRAFFDGYKAKGRIPIIDYITATDVDTVEIEFRDPIKPTSLKLSPVTGVQAPTGGDFNIKIFDADSGDKLPVKGVYFGGFGNVLVVKTAPQKGNQRYRVQIKDVESYDGKKPDVGISKTFKGYNLRAVQRQAAANLADLDGDGKVDFTDFTIFSSAYGTVYYDATAGGDTDGGDTGGAGQPIESVPDATVPITTAPTE